MMKRTPSPRAAWMRSISAPVVALEGLELDARSFRPARQRTVDVGQRRCAIVLRFAGPEQVQVRPVNDQQAFRPGALRAFLLLPAVDFASSCLQVCPANRCRLSSRRLNGRFRWRVVAGVRKALTGVRQRFWFADVRDEISLDFRQIAGIKPRDWRN